MIHCTWCNSRTNRGMEDQWVCTFVFKVSFHGQPIGGIIAETGEIARAAARLVKIEYEELPAILTLDVSLKYSTNMRNI